MIQKRILNALTLALMISVIPMPAHAGLFDSISNYFNQPTKNSLMATTAIAGTFLLASCVCAWNWWKKNQEIAGLNHDTNLVSRTYVADISRAEGAKKNAESALAKNKITLREALNRNEKLEDDNKKLLADIKQKDEADRAADAKLQEDLKNLARAYGSAWPTIESVVTGINQFFDAEDSLESDAKINAEHHYLPVD